MSCTAEDLTHDIWALILQHVDYKQRLSDCALVCRKLARAAAAATQSLDLVFNRPQRHDAFLGWTERHGSSLTSLHLESSPDHTPIRQLPCAKLVELLLNDWSVQLCASSEHLGLLHSCTALTKLVLECVELLDDGLEGPAGAAPAETARLQHFSVTLSSVKTLRHLRQGCSRTLPA
jgi:hypothetical protein